MNVPERSSIPDIWYCLQRDKEIHVVKVLERIPKENLSPEDLVKNEIKEYVEKYGYYDNVFKWSDDNVRTLDYLVHLGYVEKKRDKIYKVNWYYDAYPYLIDVDFHGSLVINLNQTTKFTHNYLTSKQYANFVATAKLFREGQSNGLHKHVKFDYNLSYFYETDIYEIKDKFFDAIFVSYNQQSNSLIIHLTEPFIRGTLSGSKKSHSKNWKRIKEISEADFLSGSSTVEKYVDTLEWKKKIKGYLIFEGEPLTLLNTPIETQDRERLTKLDFLDVGKFSAEGMRASYFEDRVADYLRSDGYSAKTRVKYHGKEIDVFADKGDDKENLVICECKLRLKSSPLTIDELENFNEKKKLVFDHELVKVENIQFWLVTNIDTMMEGVIDYANEHRIFIKIVKLPNNWQSRSDWSISENNVKTVT